MVEVEIISANKMRERIKEYRNKGLCFENVSVISFFYGDEDIQQVDYSDICDDVFYIPVPDLHYDELDEYGYTLESYIEDANSVALFIKNAVNNGNRIICQCEYGQGRSAGCAAAIKEYYGHCGVTIFADFRYHPSQLKELVD